MNHTKIVLTKPQGKPPTEVMIPGDVFVRRGQIFLVTETNRCFCLEDSSSYILDPTADIGRVIMSKMTISLEY